MTINRQRLFLAMAGILLKREPQLWSFDALIAQCKAQITSDFLAILRLFCKARKADRCRSKMSAPVSLPDAQNRYHWFRVCEPMPIQKQIEPLPLWCWFDRAHGSHNRKSNTHLFDLIPQWYQYSTDIVLYKFLRIDREQFWLSAMLTGTFNAQHELTGLGQ